MLLLVGFQSPEMIVIYSTVLFICVLGSEFADLFILLELKISFLFEPSDFLIISLCLPPNPNLIHSSQTFITTEITLERVTNILHHLPYSFVLCFHLNFLFSSFCYKWSVPFSENLFHLACKVTSLVFCPTLLIAPLDILLFIPIDGWIDG